MLSHLSCSTHFSPIFVFSGFSHLSLPYPFSSSLTPLRLYPHLGCRTGCRWYWSGMCFLFLGEGPWDHHRAGMSSNPEPQSGVNTSSSTVRPLRCFNITEGIREKAHWKPKMWGGLICWAWLIYLVGLVCWVLFVRCCLMNWLAEGDFSSWVWLWCRFE